MFSGTGMKKKIVVVSTYPPRQCGIAKYTYDLVTHLQKNHSKDYDIRVVSIEPKLHQKADYDKLKEEIGYCDILHIQDTLTWHGNRVAYANFLKAYKGKVIVTLHEVTRENWFRDVAGYVQFIVPNEKMFNEIEPELGQRGLLYNVPHGSTIVEHTSREEARLKLGLTPNKVLIVQPGFYGKDKGMLELVEAIAEIHNGELIFAGGLHPEAPEMHRTYLREVMQKAVSLGVSDKVKFVGKYLSEEELNLYCSASDIIAINHQHIFDCYSASALAKRVLCFGKPLIMSNEARLSEYEDMVNCLKVDNKGEIVDAIKHLASNRELYDKLAKGAKDYAVKTSWNNVAWETARIYGLLYYLAW